MLHAAQSGSHCWSMYDLRKPNTELADSNNFTCISAIFSIPAVLVGSGPALFCSKLPKLSRSQWPRGLRSGCAAARLLGLRFRIPRRAWISVCWECRVLSGRGLCGGPTPPPKESHRVWCSRNLKSEEAYAHKGYWATGRGGGHPV